MRRIVATGLVFACLGVSSSLAGELPPAFRTGQFHWKATAPLVDPDGKRADPMVSVKDPTVVHSDGRWHVFATVRFASGKVGMESFNFADWSEANRAPRAALALHDQYYCAPQVFYYAPHKCWYMLYQMADAKHAPPFGPVFSTSKNLADPKLWSAPQWLYPAGSPKHKWIDFWIIGDAAKMHLFFTSNNGRMWRAETTRAKYPHGWTEPELVLQADLFEASHTYKLKGHPNYLTIVEAQGDRRRYYKAYLADRLEGPWQALADTREKPFAGVANVTLDKPWTTNVSHGELLRTGCDETMEIDPNRLEFLIQGASDEEYRNHAYGQIPWRLGLLQQAP